MPLVKVTRDQFEWEGDTLVHSPSGTRINASSGVVEWAAPKEQTDGDEFSPVEIGFVAGQLLARRTRANDIQANRPRRIHGHSSTRLDAKPRHQCSGELAGMGVPGALYAAGTPARLELSLIVAPGSGMPSDEPRRV